MSEQYKVIYSPQIADDLKDIYSYIAFELSVPDESASFSRKLKFRFLRMDRILPHLSQNIISRPYCNNMDYLLPLLYT